MKILVTGGSGMVGKNFIESNNSSSFEILSPSSTEVDLTNYKETYDYLSQNKPDIVLHAAGKVGGIEANIRDPLNFLVSNLDIGRNIIMASFYTGVRKLINLGSSCIYPRNANNPLSEDLILSGELEPTNEGYALAKITTLKLCEYISNSHSQFDYKTVIPCNLYGPHDNFDPQSSHMIPSIIHKLHEAKLKQVDIVSIWGDGSARREFMYIEDLVNCLWMAIKDFKSMPNLMNIGIGKDYSIYDYYLKAAKVINYKGGFEFDTSKPVGMIKKLVDTSKSNSWGWKSKYSLKEGISKTYQFYLREYS